MLRKTSGRKKCPDVRHRPSQTMGVVYKIGGDSSISKKGECL